MTSEVMALPQHRGQPWGMTSTQSTHTVPTARTGITIPVARPFLLLDAATTAANGLAYALAGAWLAEWFGAPETVLQAVVVGAFTVGQVWLVRKG